ncbi:MAG: 50S ribosomal protein L22 [Candidatus Bathyarchaeota archaeon B23]|nr:MAG: 50S ribosomal protein L22 [Candidatus Bathyarchaeota archaeon B23]
MKGLDPDRTAIASGRDLRISPKAAREICHYLKGMNLQRAKEVLREVIELRRAIPHRRHKKKIPHRRGLQGFYAGRYPVKAAEAILKVLEAVEANAEFKGLYTDRLRIIHIAAQRGPVIRKYIYRAFGRATPYFERLTHIEVAVEEA